MVVYRERLRETCAYATVAAVLLGSLVSTAVTDRPDRTGAVIHGALVWVLLSWFSVWMIASGISLGVSGLARGATTAVAAGGDPVQTRGLHDATQVMHTRDDPTTASTLAVVTRLSNDDASAALADLWARVDMVRDDPARVAAEVHDVLAPYAERATPQATAAAAMAQRAATMGAWITVGAMAGGPNMGVENEMRKIPDSPPESAETRRRG